MTIYELSFDLDNFMALVFHSDRDAALYHDVWLRRRNGETITHMPTLNVERSKHGARGKRAKSLKQGDTADLVHGMLLLNQRARLALDDLLDGNGIDCPVSSGDLEYSAFFVTNVVDAFDYNISSYNTFPGSDNISEITKYALHEQKLYDQAIFYLKGIVPELFVSDKFVERVASHGLTGFEFLPIWSSAE